MTNGGGGREVGSVKEHKVTVIRENVIFEASNRRLPNLNTGWTKSL